MCFESTHSNADLISQQENQKLKSAASSALLMWGCCSAISFVLGVILLCVDFDKINKIVYLGGVACLDFITFILP